ncbi:MAG TPA: hypothetical protein DCG52_07035, partial [Alphaproteobacteria bacterium]|nr:hypothetical protein [Alphaproteobacteria bacterium]
TTVTMRLILLVFVSSILLAGTTATAGISTKRQDILKLIGTTYAPNGKFAWIELNGEDFWMLGVCKNVQVFYRDINLNSSARLK